MRQRRFENLPQSTPKSVSSLAEDHPAILMGVPLFEASVSETEDSPAVLVGGENNRKIGRVVTKGVWKGMPIYTVTLAERTTCPKTCYMYRDCYGNAMPFARRHMPGESFEKRLEQEIWEKARAHPNGFVVRLHVLGDFYSTEYVDLWGKLLARHPELRAFGYTARMADVASPLIGAALFKLRTAYSDRFVIRSSEPKPLPGAATVINRIPDGPTVPEGIVCPAEREATACCATCGLCWEEAARDKTIVFVRHGMGSSKSERLAEQATKTDGEGLRKIQPIKQIAKVAGAAINEPPTLLWVKPEELCVDETYQRNLSRRSLTLISRIVANWNWTHFKPPIVVKDEDTDHLYVLDGQHTAIAAASHPHVDKIPIMVVDAEQMTDRAKAFIGHNKDRITVSSLQLYHSGLVAKDSECLQVDAACAEAGVTVLRLPPSRGVFAPRQTVAINAIKSLIRSRGQETAVRILRILADAGRGPVRSDEMKAISIVVEKSNPTDEALVAVLVEHPYETALSEADEIKASSGLPLTEALATVYARALTHTPTREPETVA